MPFLRSWGFYVIATKIDEVYEVELPSAVRRLLNGFAVTVSFGLSGVSALLDCLDWRGYLPTLALYSLTPFVVAALLVVIVALQLRYTSKLTLHKLLETSAPYLLKLGFIMYPLVSLVAFDAFSCHVFEDDAGWLRSDVAIR